MKCFECKNNILENGIRYNQHWYHEWCKNLVVQRGKFQSYVCLLFGIKAPGSKIWTQRKKIISSGKVDSDIVKTLQYIYKVKKIPKPRQAGLGLVETYYDQAMEYFKQQDAKKQRIAKQAQQAMQKQKERIIISTSYQKAKQNRTLISFVQPEKGDN